MAYATQDQVLDYLQGGQQQQQGVDPTASKSMGSSGGSGIVSTGAPSAAPQGTGGSQQWTNIQSYLQANQGGQQQRAENIKQQVQGTFGQEKQQFGQKAQEAKSSAEKATEPVRSIGQDKASQLISQAASADRTGPNYQQTINPLKQALSAEIKPKGFNYGMSAEAQALGDVQDQQKFGSVLGMFDRKNQVGRDLSTGQRALQSQLDVQNPYLEQTRQDLASQYKELAGEIETGATDINKQIGDIYSQGIKSQSDLRSFLEGEAGKYQSQLDEAVAAHNAQVGAQDTEYQNYLNQLSQARSSAFDMPYQGPNARRLSSNLQNLSGISENDLLSLNYYTNADLRNLLEKSYVGKDIAGQKKEKEEFRNYIRMLEDRPTYEKGEIADLGNIDLGQQRGAYNAIMDLFGKQGIESKGTAKKSKFEKVDKTGRSLDPYRI